MTEDTGGRVSSEDPAANTDVSQSRRRKKRKWDQPAESLVSGAGFPGPGFVQPGNVMPGVMNTLTGVTSVAGGALLTNPLLGSLPTVPFPAVQVTDLLQRNAAKTKILDELLIAREIIINDAEPSLRYKLTKCQTQEEIHKCTGAVVITRGKYRQPNAPPDGEKPLYLHISAGAHLKDTAERIVAVDRAAAIVEEILNMGVTAPFLSQKCSGNGMQALSTCVFLGFDADPYLNIAARIRGPNDQYLKHIVNETGATLLLKGRGSGGFEIPDEGQEAPHIFLSASTSKSLEDAKRLAENLLDTIALECGASRVSSSKVYGAVPPPQLLLTGDPGLGKERRHITDQVDGLSVTPSATAVVDSRSAVSVPFGPVNCVQPLPNSVGYLHPLVSAGTNYMGYGGIFPQATPLQQVALALKQSSSLTSTVSPATASASATTQPKSVGNSNCEEKRHAQRRKFQELPLGSKGLASIHKEFESLRSDDKRLVEVSASGQKTMPPPKMAVLQTSSSMPPPPPPRSVPPLLSLHSPAPRSMPPPPPPLPKFAPSGPSKIHDGVRITKSTAVTDTLFKLMEYGEEDDDSEETAEEPAVGVTDASAVRKPFWAV